MKQMQVPKRQITKTIFDKYSNDQYGQTKTCPMCTQGLDIRSHLNQCLDERMMSIRNLHQIEQDQLSLGKQLCESNLKTSSIQIIREKIIRLVLTNDRTRLGLFTSRQRNELGAELEVFHLSIKQVESTRQDLIDVLQITIREARQLIKARNEEHYKKQVTKANKETNTERNRPLNHETQKPIQPTASSCLKTLNQISVSQ